MLQFDYLNSCACNLHDLVSFKYFNKNEQKPFLQKSLISNSKFFYVVLLNQEKDTAIEQINGQNLMAAFNNFVDQFFALYLEECVQEQDAQLIKGCTHIAQISRNSTKISNAKSILKTIDRFIAKSQELLEKIYSLNFAISFCWSFKKTNCSEYQLLTSKVSLYSKIEHIEYKDLKIFNQSHKQTIKGFVAGQVTCILKINEEPNAPTLPMLLNQQKHQMKADQWLLYQLEELNYDGFNLIELFYHAVSQNCSVFPSFEEFKSSFSWAQNPQYKGFMFNCYLTSQQCKDITCYEFQQWKHCFLSQMEYSLSKQRSAKALRQNELLEPSMQKHQKRECPQQDDSKIEFDSHNELSQCQLPPMHLSQLLTSIYKENNKTSLTQEALAELQENVVKFRIDLEETFDLIKA
ncbi:hypothetical protein ABPG74_018050 [Tetrahymena malaccensis]